MPKFFWVNEESEIFAGESEQQVREHHEQALGVEVEEIQEVSAGTFVWLDEARTVRGTLAQAFEQGAMALPYQVTSCYT